MALKFIQRAMQSALAKLGEGSLLNGVACGKVALQAESLEDAGIGDMAHDNTALVRRIAIFYSGDLTVKTGDLLEHPDGRFKVDSLLVRDQYQQVFVMVPA